MSMPALLVRRRWCENAARAKPGASETGGSEAGWMVARGCRDRVSLKGIFGGTLGE